MERIEHYITEIKIEELRHLFNITIELKKNKRTNLLLTGKNGSGKTTVLQAVKKYLNAITEEKYSKINNDYLNGINISDYIENKVWYVGGIKDNVNANPKDIAINEVGENRNTGATVTAKIGLPYISDYIYAGDASNKNTYGTVISKSNNWLYSSDLWFITRYNLSFTNVYYLGNDGSLILGNINDVRFVRPTFYLKKSTKIVSGDGTRSNPYQIG